MRKSLNVLLGLEEEELVVEPALIEDDVTLAPVEPLTPEEVIEIDENNEELADIEVALDDEADDLEEAKAKVAELEAEIAEDEEVVEAVKADETQEAVLVTPEVVAVSTESLRAYANFFGFPEEKLHSFEDISAVDLFKVYQISIEEKKNMVSRALRAIGDRFKIYKKGMDALESKSNAAAAGVTRTITVLTDKLKKKYETNEKIDLTKVVPYIGGKLGGFLDLYCGGKFDASVPNAIKKEFTGGGKLKAYISAVAKLEKLEEQITSLENVEKIEKSKLESILKSAYDIMKTTLDETILRASGKEVYFVEMSEKSVEDIVKLKDDEYSRKKALAIFDNVVSDYGTSSRIGESRINGEIDSKLLIAMLVEAAKAADNYASYSKALVNDATAIEKAYADKQDKAVHSSAKAVYELVTSRIAKDKITAPLSSIKTLMQVIAKITK